MQKGIIISKMHFPIDSLQGRKINGVRFENCYFERTSAIDTSLSECEFAGCEFERLDWDVSTTKILNCQLIII